MEARVRVCYPTHQRFNSKNSQKTTTASKNVMNNATISNRLSHLINTKFCANIHHTQHTQINSVSIAAVNRWWLQKIATIYSNARSHYQPHGHKPHEQIIDNVFFFFAIWEPRCLWFAHNFNCFAQESKNMYFRGLIGGGGGESRQWNQQQQQQQRPAKIDYGLSRMSNGNKTRKKSAHRQNDRLIV